MKIIFFGPPGSGKGTQAKLIADELSISHLSTGDILREKINDQDDLSLQLKEIMSSGNLVSDVLLNKIISDKLLSKECSNGFILDGYPRTITQSDFLSSFLEEKNMTIDFIFDFKIDFKTVEERIILRAQKEKRTDDNLEVVKTRLSKYMEETYPVSQVLSNNFASNYFSLDASMEIYQIQKELLKILKNQEN
jgi:adenylate kinase